MILFMKEIAMLLSTSEFMATTYIAVTTSGQAQDYPRKTRRHPTRVATGDRNVSEIFQVHA
jgi:hypothetical protein